MSHAAKIQGLMGSEAKQAIEENWKKAKEADQSASDLPGFITLLNRKYGTIVAAWALCLDRTGTGKVSWGNFCKDVRGVGYSGNAKTLWAQLDDDKSGTIGLEEIDSNAAELLKEFRDKMEQTFGDMIKGWNTILAGQTGLDKDNFEQRMEVLGLSKPKKLFKLLVLDRGQKQLALDDALL